MVIQDITLDTFGHLSGLATVDLDNRYTQSGNILWMLTGDSGTASSIGVGATATFTGGEGIDTSISSGTLTIAGEDATTTNKGIASFSSSHFTVSSGAVSSLLNKDLVAGNGLSVGEKE